MKKNVLKALFVGMVLSASLRVEASIEQIEATRDKVLKFGGNAPVRKALILLDNDHMGQRPELDWSKICDQILAILNSGEGGIAKNRALSALLPQIEHIIRTAAAAVPVSLAPQPAAPAAAAAAADSNRISHSCDSVPDTPPHIPLNMLTDDAPCDNSMVRRIEQSFLRTDVPSGKFAARPGSERRR